ncbi:MAG: hypothetical protein KAG92_08185, partial [Deltaproteobacteria bacterium]|nr:hypothetical protein [Deltaproteobacteria bacterium]
EAELKLMLNDYYHLRGWDKNGIPMKQTEISGER